MKLTTKRLIIRPLALSDHAGFFAYRSDSDANKYQGWIPKTLADAELFINKLTHEINTPNSWYQLALIEKTNNKLIGDLGLHFFDAQNKQVEVGCTIGKAYQQKGYASEAITQVIHFLFTELQKHRVVASIDPKNIGSIRLVEHIGFRKEGHFRESLWMNNEWVDDVVYALLAKDWLKIV